MRLQAFWGNGILAGLTSLCISGSSRNLQLFFVLLLLLQKCLTTCCAIFGISLLSQAGHSEQCALCSQASLDHHCASSLHKTCCWAGDQLWVLGLCSMETSKARVWQQCSRHPEQLRKVSLQVLGKKQGSAGGGTPGETSIARGAFRFMWAPVVL
jgi:hypothetical protein